MAEDESAPPVNDACVCLNPSPGVRERYVNLMLRAFSTHLNGGASASGPPPRPK